MEVLGGTGKILGKYQRHWMGTRGARWGHRAPWAALSVFPRCGVTERVKGHWDSSWQVLGHGVTRESTDAGWALGATGLVLIA